MTEKKLLKQHRLILLKKEKIATNIHGFWFRRNGKGFDYIPGQYLEWELLHEKPDDRGTERYFTIASSPEKARTRSQIVPSSRASKESRASFGVNATHYGADGEFGFLNNQSRAKLLKEN